MPTRIVETETVIRIHAEHKCSDGYLASWAVAEGKGRFDWTQRGYTICQHCGERLPQTIAELEA